MERLALDACTVINLWAADILGDLADRCGVELVVAEIVTAEAMYVEPDDPGSDRESIDWNALRDHGTITPLALDGEQEIATYLGFIPRLGDGEAASLAIAHQREFVAATDDSLALRVAAECDPPISTVTTPDIVSWWADAASAEDHRIGEAIARIERRARFRPSPGHPLAEWWRRACL